MKALIFSVLALAISIQADATCAARAGKKLQASPTYDNQMPDSRSSQVQKSVQTQQPTATVRGRK